MTDKFSILRQNNRQLQRACLLLLSLVITSCLFWPDDDMNYQPGWILSGDTTRLPNPIITITRDSGSLLFAWQPYDASVETILERNVNGKTIVNYPFYEPFHSFRDTLFLSGDFSCTVYVSRSNSRVSSKTTATFTDHHVPGVLSFKELAQGSGGKVVIAGSHYPANVTKIEVFDFSPGQFDPARVIFSTPRADDTVFTFKPTFGTPRALSVKTTGRYTPWTEGRAFVESEFFPYLYGEPLPSHSQILFSDNHDRFYLYGGGTLSGFTISGNSLVRSIPMAPLCLNLSFNKDIVLAGFADRVEAYQAQTLDLLWTEPVSTLISFNNQLLGVGLTADGQLIVSTGSELFPQDPQGPVIVYDRDAKKVTRTIPNAGWGNTVDLSADGVYLAVGDKGNYFRVAHLTGDVIDRQIVATPTTVLEPLGSDFQHWISTSVINSYEAISVFRKHDVAAGTSIEMFRYANLTTTEVDVQARLAVGWMPKNQALVINFDTGNVIWEGPASTNDLKIHGGYLYSPNARLKIQP